MIRPALAKAILMARLAELARMKDKERAEYEAIDALLIYINDPEIRQAFERVA